jgi:hypothetical protein
VWSFAELVEWYASKLELNATVVVENGRRASPLTQGFSAVSNWATQGLSGVVGHYRELLSAIVSKYSEDLDQKLRFARTRKIAASTMNAYFDNLLYRPFEVLNEIPGTRFPFTSDSRATMKRVQEDVEALIRHLI